MHTRLVDPGVLGSDAESDAESQVEDNVEKGSIPSDIPFIPKHLNFPDDSDSEAERVQGGRKEPVVPQDGSAVSRSRSSSPPSSSELLARPSSEFPLSFQLGRPLSERYPGINMRLYTLNEAATVFGPLSFPSSSSPPAPMSWDTEFGRPLSEHYPGARLFKGDEAAFLCDYPSREAFSSSLRDETAAEMSRQHEVALKRQEAAARRRVVAETSTRRRSSRLQTGVSASSTVARAACSLVVKPASATPSHMEVVPSSESPLSSAPASPAADPVDGAGPSSEMDVDTSIVHPVQSYIALWSCALPWPDAILEAAPRVSWESVAYVQCRLILSRLRLVQLARSSSTLSPLFTRAIQYALDMFWELDKRLFSHIADWDLDRNVYLFGSGLVRAPAVIIAFIVPIFKFPPEILALIFAHVCFLDEPFSQAFFIARCRLSLVCHHWSTAARSASVLWSTVVVHPKSSSHYVQSILDSPSGGRLSVFVTHLVVPRRGPSHVTQDRFFDLCTSLSSTAERWRSFVVHSSDLLMVFRILRHLDSHFAPALECLAISASGVEPSPYRFPTSCPIPFGGQFPSLKVLRLDSIPLLLDVLPPLPALVELTIGGTGRAVAPSHLAFRSILVASPRLALLHLMDVGCLAAPPGDLPSLTCSSLLELHITFGYTSTNVQSVLRLLLSLRLTGLQHFRVYFPDLSILQMYNTSYLELPCSQVTIRAPWGFELAAIPDVVSFYASFGALATLDISTAQSVFCHALAPETIGVGSLAVPNLMSLTFGTVSWCIIRDILGRRLARGGETKFLHISTTMPQDLVFDDDTRSAHARVLEVIGKLSLVDAAPLPSSYFSGIYSISRDVRRLE
ncbi:hypothetical protein C8F04DRAFT_1259935 [Mycena alexandri]|uniref:F-box domain-containing protein n=1 Tax=Mycena alexandri TaxID=1745969 RepID=A0AAD6X3P4_9AGAR|nr:hypothetical protein C8F04DRAFT_1259935 [Mycena alexandri]